MHRLITHHDMHQVLSIQSRLYHASKTSNHFYSQHRGWKSLLLDSERSRLAQKRSSAQLVLPEKKVTDTSIARPSTATNRGCSSAWGDRCATRGHMHHWQALEQQICTRRCGGCPRQVTKGTGYGIPWPISYALAMVSTTVSRTCFIRSSLICYSTLKPSDRYFPLDDRGLYQLADIDYVTAYKAMERLVWNKQGRAIGVCNFNIRQLDDQLSDIDVVPAVNQIEAHTCLAQTDLFCF